MIWTLLTCFDLLRTLIWAFFSDRGPQRVEKYGKVFPGCYINNVSSIFSRFYAFGGCYKHSIDGVLIPFKIPSDHNSSWSIISPIFVGYILQFSPVFLTLPHRYFPRYLPHKGPIKPIQNPRNPITVNHALKLNEITMTSP